MEGALYFDDANFNLLNFSYNGTFSHLFFSSVSQPLGSIYKAGEDLAGELLSQTWLKKMAIWVLFMNFQRLFGRLYKMKRSWCIRLTSACLTNFDDSKPNHNWSPGPAQEFTLAVHHTFCIVLLFLLQSPHKNSYYLMEQ